MPWFYKIDVPIKDVEFALDNAACFKQFDPLSVLFIYQDDVDECYVVASKDIFPPNLGWSFRRPIRPIASDDEALNLYLNIDSFKWKGDYSLLGDNRGWGNRTEEEPELVF